MGREHGRGVHHRVALDRGFFLERGIDPGRRQTEGRLGGVSAGQGDLLAARVHDHVLAVPDFAGAGFHLLDLDDIGVGIELDVVEDAHRGHDKAHFDRQRAAQRLDLFGQLVAAVRGIDERQQCVAEFDFKIVHFQRRRHRLFRGRWLGVVGLFRLRGGGLFVPAVNQIGQGTGAAAKCKERNHRNAGQQRHDQHDGGRHAERFRISGELAEQRFVGGAADAGLGDQETGGDRDDERRNLCHQAVADGEQCVGLGGFGEGQALLQNADHHAADDVDQHDQETGDGVAAHEFRSAVHGAEETGLVLQVLAALTRHFLVDETGGEIGIDRHLLAGHGIEVETGRHLGDAARTFGDDDEVHDHQDGEDNNANDEIAAHDKMAERFDDMPGCAASFMAVGEDEPRRGKIERQPQAWWRSAGRSETRKIRAAPG